MENEYYEDLDDYLQKNEFPDENDFFDSKPQEVEKKVDKKIKKSRNERKYVINDEIFSNKNEISDRCRTIVKNNVDKDLVGNDLNFIIELFLFHPDFTKLICAKRIFVGLDNKGRNYHFFIQYIDDRIDDVSWTKCVKHIPFNEDHQINFKMPFGKYNGELLIDVYEKDSQYIEWLSQQTWVKRGMKVFLNQVVRYGFIPFNPTAYYYYLEKRKSDNM